MKALLLAGVSGLALLAIIPDHQVKAQNTQCTTRPAGDSSNACASTAFVQTNAAPQGFDPVAYGADCTGATDSTAAAQATVAAIIANGGGKFWIRSGCHLLVSGSGAEILKPTIAMTFEGADEATSQIIVASSTSATTDIIHFAFPASTFNVGGSVRNLSIIPQSGTPGRTGIYLDTTASNASSSNFLIDHANIQPLGGFSVALINGANANGGTFHFMISNSNLIGGTSSGGCVWFSNAGDTLRIYNNILAGNGNALLSTTVAGAGNLQLVGNNISAAGMIKIDDGYKPTIAWNEIEQQVTSTEPNGALIDINGGAGTVESAQIWGNQIQANASIGNPTLLRIANAVGTMYDYNRFGTPAIYAPVVLVGGANAQEGDHNTYNISGTEQFKGSYSAITSNTIANSNVGSALCGPYSSIPAFTFQPGNVIRVRAAGLYGTTAGAQTYGLSVTIQGVIVTSAPTGTTLAGGLTAQPWTMEQDITIRGTGSTTAQGGFGNATFLGSFTSAILQGVGTGSAINTGNSTPVVINWQWGTANAANTITCSTFTVEVLKPSLWQ